MRVAADLGVAPGDGRGWALYEAWVRLQHGDADVALVYSWERGARSSRIPAAVGSSMTYSSFSL